MTPAARGASAARKPHTIRAGDAPPPPAPRTDAGLAITSLLKSHGPRIHALALRLCGNQADAQDMVQDVFLQAYRRWETFQGRADPGTWLYAIAARACRSRRRRKGGTDKRTPAVSQLMPWKETTVMELAAAPREEESPAEHQEALTRVQRAIARLPDHLRLPLVLKELSGMSVDEAAAALGLTANTLKTRLHRARLALRKAMTARAAAVEAPAPIYEKQVCLDLLQAKLEAMDRGGRAAGHIVPQGEVCARCRAVFRELDLVQEACTQMASGQMPPALERKIRLALADRAHTAQPPKRGPGRRPVTPGTRRRD